MNNITFKHNNKRGAQTRVSRNKSRQNGLETTSVVRMTTPSYIPRMLIEASDSVTVVEESSFPITSLSGGSISNLYGISLNSVTAFAASWLNIYDEWRLLQVQFRYHSRVGSNTPGAIVVYLERDLGDTAASTLLQGYRQQESQEFRPWDDFVTAPKLTTLQWKPKDPSDFEYQNASSNIVFNLGAVAENLPASTTVGSMQVFARIQFRGRSTSA